MFSTALAGGFGGKIAWEVFGGPEWEFELAGGAAWQARSFFSKQVKQLGPMTVHAAHAPE